MTTSVISQPHLQRLETTQTHDVAHRDRADRLVAALNRVNLDDVRARFAAQNEFVCLESLLPDSLTAEMVAEARRMGPLVRRKHVPFYKKSGSVSYWTIREHAPSIVALYESPAFMAFVEDVTCAKLTRCPDDDPHACALYYYTEAGDHIGWHYDSSHYAGSRYTILIGLVERSSSRLLCQLYDKDPSKRQDLQLATHPGTFVLFNGDKLYHAVSPLGENEERIVLTLEYVTDTRMTPFRRAVSNLKDAMTYFGFGELLRGRARKNR